MKKLLCVFALLLLPLCLTACDEQKTINAIRLGQTTANSAGQALYVSLQIAHAAGQISDARWQQFLAAWDKYIAADKLLTDGLATWESGVGKPPLERLQALLLNLNTLITDIRALIESWGKQANGGFAPIRI